VKHLLFSVVVGLAFVAPEQVQAFSFFPVSSVTVSTCCPCHKIEQSSASFISSDAIVTGVFACAFVIGFIGLERYCSKQQPFWNLSSAKSFYSDIDQKLITLFDKYDAGIYDFAQFSSSLYIDSPYALVTVSERLKLARSAMLQAHSFVEAALNSYVREESFVAECRQLRRNINERIDLINKHISFAHMHPLWTQQYALYMQDCNYREMIRLQEKRNRDLYHLQGRVEELSRQNNNSIGNVVVVC